MNDLQTLVRLYLIGNMTFDAFREAMVRGFLTARNTPEALESIVNAIESDADDFFENRITESIFRSKLVAVLRTPESVVISVEPIIIDPPHASTVMTKAPGLEVNNVATGNATLQWVAA